MADVAIEPALKRRKISKSASQDVRLSDNSARTSYPVSMIPRRIGARHPHAHQHSAGKRDESEEMIPRQDTSSAANASSTSTSSSVVSDSSASTSSSSSTNTSTTSSTSHITNGIPTTSTVTTESTTSLAPITTTVSVDNGDSSTSITSSNSSSSSSASSTATSSNSSKTTSVNSKLLYTATLVDGETVVLTRSSHVYTISYSDGQVFTVPALSTSSSSRNHSTATATPTPTTRLSTIYKTDSVSATTSPQNTVTSVAVVFGGSDGSSTSSSTASTSTGASLAGVKASNNTSPPPGTIAGGVVGGAAGLAVVVLIAMLFIRWFRKRNQLKQQEAIGPASAMSRGPEGPSSPRGPGMAERAGLMPLAGAVPSFFRHQNRSPSTTEPSERGFTRVSGRKLPSAFSEGMTSPPQSNVPMYDNSNNSNHTRDLSSQSFYRDSYGFYGGEGDDIRTTSPTNFSRVRSGTHETMTMSPGPQRRPTVHQATQHGTTQSPFGDGSYQVPTAASAMLTRSITPSSSDYNRNSRFTEQM